MKSASGTELRTHVSLPLGWPYSGKLNPVRSNIPSQPGELGSLRVVPDGGSRLRTRRRDGKCTLI